MLIKQYVFTLKFHIYKLILDCPYLPVYGQNIALNVLAYKLHITFKLIPLKPLKIKFKNF